MLCQKYGRVHCVSHHVGGGSEWVRVPIILLGGGGGGGGADKSMLTHTCPHKSSGED